MSEPREPIPTQFYVAAAGIAPERPIVLSHDFGGVVTHGETWTLTAQGAVDHRYRLSPKAAGGILRRRDRRDEHGKELKPPLPASLLRALEQRASKDGNDGAD